MKTKKRKSTKKQKITPRQAARLVNLNHTLHQRLEETTALLFKQNADQDVAHHIYQVRYRSFTPELRAMLDKDWENFTRQAFINKYELQKFETALPPSIATMVWMLGDRAATSHEQQEIASQLWQQSTKPFGEFRDYLFKNYTIIAKAIKPESHGA